MVKNTRNAWSLCCLLPLVLAVLVYPLAAAEQPQTAIVYLHGFCGEPDTWVPLVSNLQSRITQDSQSPLAQSYASSYYYVRFDGQNVSYAVLDPHVGNFAARNTIDTTVRVFLVSFYAPNVPTSDPNYTLSVANISILNKAYELASILADIKQRFGVSDFIVVGHSMGGLVARAYLEGLALGSTHVPPASDVRRLITVDTPHLGAASALLLQDLGLPLTFCPAADSVNQRELSPSLNNNTLNSIISSVQSIAQSVPINSIVSNAPGVTLLDKTYVTSQLCSQDDDSVVCKSEQALLGRSNWTTKDDVYGSANLTSDNCHVSGLGPILHLLQCLTSSANGQSSVFNSVYDPLSTELLASFAEQSGIVGFIDAAVGPSGTATITKGDNLTVQGWAADKVRDR